MVKHRQRRDDQEDHGDGVGFDDMGPESAKSFPGQRLVHARHPPEPNEPDPPAERARQEIDYGRRGKRYIFGGFRPATGEALPHPYSSRSIAHWAEFLERIEGWIPAEVRLLRLAQVRATRWTIEEDMAS